MQQQAATADREKDGKSRGGEAATLLSYKNDRYSAVTAVQQHAKPGGLQALQKQD
ncbi:hypothetical protein ACO0LO_19220 [Undibacterium sp. TJN25]|uniref:hypothetical protein n=1 Tax=Undibacterium sp. TJN25 TaxID=3413056 RepID=UPI003BF01914